METQRSSISTLLCREDFESCLRAAHSQYHHVHGFHRLMNKGELNNDQIRGWVANRFRYQQIIPLKDAAILSNCPLREVRRVWIHRIIDHDGTQEGDGGIEAWLQLARACGLSQEEMLDERHVVAGVRAEAEAYVQLARTAPWPVAVASSLTEIFAPDLIAERIAAFETHYTWIPSWGLDYFRSRVVRAKGDSAEGLQLTLTHCNTPALQRQAVEALHLKCRILRRLLDAIAEKYCPEAMHV